MKLAEFSQAANIAHSMDQRAQMQQQSGDLAGAIASWTAAIDHLQSIVDQISALPTSKEGEMTGELQKVVPHLKFNQAEYHVDRGLAYYAIRQPEHAITDYSQAIAHAPTIARAYYNRALVYHDRQDLSAAIQDYSQAIQHNPNHAMAYGNRGNCYREMQDYPTAIQDYDQAIRLQPTAIDYYNRAEAYNLLGCQSRQRSHFQQAIADLSQVIALDPSYTIAYYKRGRLGIGIGDVETGRADLQQAIALAEQQGNTKLAQLALKTLGE